MVSSGILRWSSKLMETTSKKEIYKVIDSLSPDTGKELEKILARVGILGKGVRIQKLDKPVTALTEYLLKVIYTCRTCGHEQNQMFSMEKSVDKSGLQSRKLSFGEEVPKVQDKKAYNILVVHQMICDQPLYPGHQNVHPAAFLRRNPEFNLIVCGDYHYRFASHLGNRIAINPGALMRLELGDIKTCHRPAVVVFDTEENTFEVVELKVQENIFDLTEEPKKDEHSQVLAEFLEQLKQKKELRVGWKEILFLLLEKENNPCITNIVDDCLKEV